MILPFGLLAVLVATLVEVDLAPEKLLPQLIQRPPEETNTQKTDRVSLDSTGDVDLTWWLDYKNGLVTLRISFSDRTPPFDWFAFGFSDRGLMTNADYCLLVLEKRKARLVDVHSDENGTLRNDVMEDCLDFSWNEEEKTLQFSRYFDTCDQQDYVIEEGTTHIIWARGNGSASYPPSVPDEDQGMVRTRLLTTDEEPEPLPYGTKIFEVTVKELKVPAIPTLYQCKVFKLPEWLLEKKHHIVQFEAIISESSEGLVHHIELFYCDAPADEDISMYEGSCFDLKRPKDTQVCAKVRSAWAMGAPPFKYPEQAGLSFGGPYANSYVMLEVHYNNPLELKDYVDSSGIRIYLSPTLRKYEASILEFGLEYIDKMTIPPNLAKFELAGFCTVACTKTALPSGGIVIFGSQLHTHLLGKSVKTRHIRSGIELPPIDYDLHYNSSFQEIRILKRFVHIKPGDLIITSCVYDSSEKNNVTFGGHSIQDEMCVNYVHYYPATDLEVCKSSVSTKALNKFFEEELRDNFAPEKGVRANYNSVKAWDEDTIDKLKRLYFEDTISMQCNSSNGDRFPGSWDTNKIDPIYVPYHFPERKCPELRRGYNLNY